MQIYFYCSYERSQTGYFMTTFQNGKQFPQNIQMLPPPMNTFFFVDRFRLLWTDIPESNTERLMPKVVGSFFGVRNISGQWNCDRKGFVNIGFYAGENEKQLLQRIALNILQDFSRFCSFLLGCMSVGGEFSYQIDGEKFGAWLDKAMSCNKMQVRVPMDDPIANVLPAMQRTDAPIIDKELLRLLVLETSWQDVRGTMGWMTNWKDQPANALGAVDFERLFVRRSMPWEMIRQ